MASSLPTFYTYPLAFNPAKAKLALEECNIKYVEKKVDILGGQSLEPWFIKLNPSSAVPALVVGEDVINESAEIVRWADSQGTPLGGNKVDRQFIDQWINKVDRWDGNLFAAAFGPAGGILKLTAEYKIKVAEAQAKKNPDLAEVYKKKIENIKASIDEPDDKAKCDACKAELTGLLDEAESRLASSAYLAGEEYSAADVIFTPCLYRIPQVKLDKELIEPRSNVKRYWASLKKRPSYKKTFGVADSPLGAASTALPAFGKIFLSKLTKKY